MNIPFFSQLLQRSGSLILTGICAFAISAEIHAQSLEPLKNNKPNITFKLYTWQELSKMESELDQPTPMYFQQQGGKSNRHLIAPHEQGVSLSQEYTFPIGSKLTFFKKATTPKGEKLFTLIDYRMGVENYSNCTLPNHS